MNLSTAAIATASEAIQPHHKSTRIRQMTSVVVWFGILSLTATAQTQKPPRLTQTKLSNTYKLEWESIAGRTYFVQQSGDLINWTYYPKVMAGVGGNDWMSTVSASDKRFFRLLRSNVPTVDPITADHDGDGIPSYAELTVTQTDPLKYSTAGTKVSDRGLFPNPANSVYLDTVHGVQYNLIPNPPGVSGPKAIVAIPNFDSPDYGLQFKKGERQLEKKGYVEFTGTSNKRYLTWERFLWPTNLNGDWIVGNWQFGESQGISLPQIRYVAADYNSGYKNNIDPFTGTETITGAGFGNTYYSTANSVATLLTLPWGYQGPILRTNWMGKVMFDMQRRPFYYDLPPYSPNWDAAGYLYYVEQRTNENTIANVQSVLRANPPAYPSTWTDGNPWATWDVWSTQMGATYQRLKFRVQNKNGAIGDPAKVVVFFDPKSGGARETVMNVEWDGQSQYSPEYTIDPAVLKPGVEGTFHVGLGTMYFELDEGQTDNRKAGGSVLIPVPQEGETPTNALRVRGLSVESALPNIITILPAPSLKFPGMDDTWYDGATITLTKTGGTGAVSMKAIDPYGGAEVNVPLGANLAADFFHSRGLYSTFNWVIQGVAAGPISLTLTYTKGTTTLSTTRTALVVGIPNLASDLNNDGVIDLGDVAARKAAAAPGATVEAIEAGTEYLFANDNLSNGAWDKDDADPERPTSAIDDDDTQAISINPGVTEGQLWFDHPAIAGLSFYRTRECKPEDRINLTASSMYFLSPSNPLPATLYARADGPLVFPDANPQIEGDLTLYFRATTNDPGYALAKMKLILVKEFGASAYFQATNDYILENNTELFVHEKNFGRVIFRLCLMREEATHVLPMELYEPARDNWIQAGSVAPFSAYTFREAAGISEVMAHDPGMTVVINGNQCGFTSGLLSVEAAAMAALGDYQMTDKCQGRLKELNLAQSPVSNDYFDENTNIPGTELKGSVLAGPDPLPGTSPPEPGGKYVAQYSNGKINVGLNFAPDLSASPSPSSMLAQMGGLSTSYANPDRNNYNNSLVGTAPVGKTGKNIVFVAMGKNGNVGKGKTLELYNAAVGSGVPQISGATTPSGTLPPISMVFLDSGVTSCALAHKNPSGTLSLLYKGTKHNGLPYYTNTFLRFQSTKPRP